MNQLYTNERISNHLTDIATALEIKKENRFRIVAYKNAADTAISYNDDIYKIWQKNPKELDLIPNFGQAICEKLDYLFTHDQPHPHVKEYFSGIHPAVFSFTKINGVGPKNAHKITQVLKFSRHDPSKAFDQLIRYCQKHKIRSIPTFGEKSEKLILENTLSFLGRNSRMPLDQAQTLANSIVEYLHLGFPKLEFYPLGSLRRQSSTVGDIDIAVASTESRDIINYFLQYPQKVSNITVGKNKASIKLLHDIHVDLMIKPPKSFGSLLQHFTGSRQHNIILRRYALKLGFSLSEYGVRDTKTKQLHTFATEEKFYNFLKLNWIPPEKRVGENELEDYKMV